MLGSNIWQLNYYWRLILVPKILECFPKWRWGNLQSTVLETFFSFKIIGRGLVTFGLLIQSNWTLAILLFLFLGLLGVLRACMGYPLEVSTVGYFVARCLYTGVAKLFWRAGCTVIYRLRLWSATVPARLPFSLADTLHCFKPQTLCLPFQS